MTKAPERFTTYNVMMSAESGKEVPSPEGKWVRFSDHIDHALALVAAAYEDAAQHHDYHATQYTRISSNPDAAAHAEHAKQIRARTNDDAQAALERVKQEARNEALREAAEAARSWYHNLGKGTPQDEILALITEDQSDG